MRDPETESEEWIRQKAVDKNVVEEFLHDCVRTTGHGPQQLIARPVRLKSTPETPVSSSSSFLAVFAVGSSLRTGGMHHCRMNKGRKRSSLELKKEDMGENVTRND